ncbi:M20 family metallopeptidase [Crassaminicella profunda]|uniref:M20 family metallopeptidase n=1 Tax=Crassaminicella profunda TaxID=1286698 RepID=UPI001CA762CB|nr:M20 family metallopeptidase [Crassaminicella profunda]QZY54055.1 M20 family metallopeptidase [Crassaminicella profunda]
MGEKMIQEKIDQLVKMYQTEIESISDYIFNHPELGCQEYKSSKFMVDVLKKHNFKIEYPYLEIDTSFRAEFGDEEGPVIAFLAEYDALPGYGEEKKPAHACGHNWIAATTVGAGIVLSKIKDAFKGKIVVVGTPAEETVGSKVDLVNRGAFKDINAVFQMHLYEENNLRAKALAMDSWEFEFVGKASHAASYPFDGINALDAVNLTFAGISALRQQLKPDVRIHGIITKGGEAANIIPDYCSCKFYVRAEKRSYLDIVSEKVKNCARGAALMTGAKLKINQFENSYDDLVVNKALLEITRKNLENVGFKNFSERDEIPGSTDIGNVSYAAPTMYGNIGIADGKAKVHEEEFLQYANSKEAKEKIRMVVRAFAYSALELFKNEELMNQVQEEFEKIE